MFTRRSKGRAKGSRGHGTLFRELIKQHDVENKGGNPIKISPRFLSVLGLKWMYLTEFVWKIQFRTPLLNLNLDSPKCQNVNLLKKQIAHKGQIWDPMVPILPILPPFPSIPTGRGRFHCGEGPRGQVTLV